MNFRVLDERDVETLDAFLREHAASSMFLRSNLRAAGIAYQGKTYQSLHAGAFDGERLIAVMGHAWNDNLLLQAPVAAGPLASFAVERSKRPVAGILGPAEQVADARLGLRMGNTPVSFEGLEDLYALDLNDLAVPEPLASGEYTCRHSREEELPHLIEWRVAYCEEALHAVDGPDLREESREWIERSHRENVQWVLEDGGRPVAMTCFNAWLPDSVQVGGVWTPPEFRGRGYARSVVAGSLLEAKSNGVPQAILFTDTPAAHRAYRALGFRVVGEYALVLFQTA